MPRHFFFMFIGVFFGAGLGFLIAAGNGITLDGHDHAGDHGNHGSTAMDHANNHGTPVDVPASDTAPTVDLVMHQDAVSGWNLEVITRNFEFSPETVNQTNAPSQGHAHVYVNGEKLARIYGPWMHIGKLPAGETTISVSLNANDHSPISVGGKIMSAETTISVE